MSLDAQISSLNKIIETIILRINIENKLNDYFFNHLCEDIFNKTFSEIFNQTFSNINIERTNAPGIDLWSKNKKICVQISSTGDTTKLYRTLRKFLKQEEYKDCEKLYFFIIGQKEGQYSRAEQTVKEILNEPDNKIKNFQFDIDKDIIELKFLSKTLIENFSELYENRERTLSHESLFRIVEDLSKSINGIEYALKPILQNDKNEYLKNDCLEKPQSISRRLIDEKNFIFSEEDLTSKAELKYTFIYGDAGLGKTQLFNKLSIELFENSILNFENILPYIINLKNINHNISIDKQLPQYFGKRFQSLLIFDGYDEISIQEQIKFKESLIQYLEFNKNTRCIIGSRTKIKNDEITFFLKNDSNNKKHSFKTLKIDFFNEHEINDFIKNKKIENSIFNDKNFQKLFNDLKNPYYLDLITSYYKDYGNLPENKLIVLDKLVNKNLIRLTSNNNRMLAIETRTFLEKLSFIFYFTEIKVLKDTELAKIIKYKDEIWKLLDKHDALIFNENYEHWEISLVKQKELDFLFYSLIKKIDPKTLFEILDEDTILPDTWYNSLILFNDDNEISHEIKDEMRKKFPFIFIKEFQSNPNDSYFSDDLRTKIFQEIFNKYEKKDIWIDFKIFDEKSYVQFGDTDENFNFLISKITSENQRTKNKAISLLKEFEANNLRCKTLVSVLKPEVNDSNNKYVIKEIYNCISNYINFLAKEERLELINLSTKSKIEFLKYNEYVRSGVYNLILSCDLQDEFLEYMLEGLEIIKFSNKGKYNGRDKTTLLDEGIYLDKLFFNLKSKMIIVKSFDKLFNNFRIYDDYHSSRIFDHLIKKSTEIIITNKNIKTFKGKLISTLSKYNIKNDNWFYWKEMIVNFKLDLFIIDILKSEKLILKNLINDEKIFKNHFLISVDGISKLITEKNYHLIIESIDNELINIEQAIGIYEFIDNRDKKLSNKIKPEIIARGGKIESNVESKYDILNEERIKNFELLFDKEKFKKDIINYFRDQDIIELSWEKIPNWYQGELYFHGDFRIEFLRRVVRYDSNRIIHKNKTLNKLNNNLDWVLVDFIFEKKNQFNYKLSNVQINFLKNWIKREVIKMNFRNAIHSVKNNSFSIDEDCLKIFKYIKELNIQVDKKTSLDLLSYTDFDSISSNYNDNYANYFETLIKHINDFELVKKRVFENLKNKIKYSNVLNNHIIFSFKYNFIENYKLIEDLLTEYLPELQVGHYHDNPLIVYYDKSKNFEFIKNIFPLETTDLFWTIIDYLINNNEHLEFVEEKLLLNFDNSADYNIKLKISAKLLKINSKNALEKFFAILSEIKNLDKEFRLFDIKDCINEYKNEEIETAVNLLELTFRFEFDSFDNPIRDVSNYLKNMIKKNKDNYEKIKNLITSIIESNKGKINNIQFLEYELNSYKETFYSNYKNNYSLKDALEIISKIDS